MNGRDSDIGWRFANAQLDEGSRELLVGGNAIDIEPKAFEVLLVLLQNAGEVVTIAEFLDAVWPGRIVAESAVTNLISKLRKALGDEDQGIIRTVPRVGYRLIATVERVATRQHSSNLEGLHVGKSVPGREQWQLAESLGAGGFGDVWLARHVKTGEQRVFKFCVESSRLAALKREVTLSRLLKDGSGPEDRYVRILEWNFESPPYFIESLYAGKNLRAWFETQPSGGIPLPERIELIIAVAEALAAAHAIGVLHKDLKPENILILEEPGKRSVRLGDFGSGRLLDAGKLGELGITRLGFTQTSAIDDSTSGTLPYMAPELLSGGVPSVQSDIYSIGIMLYQLVTGDINKLISPGWESDIADELLAQDIRDATHGSRDHRLPSVQLLVDRLKNLASRREQLDHQRGEQRRAQLAIEAQNRSRARRPWLIAAAVVLLSGIVVSSYFFQRAREEARIAQEQARRAESVRDFLGKDLFASISSGDTPAKDVTVPELLHQAGQQVDSRFASDPLVAAEVHATLGRAFYDIYIDEEARLHFRRALDLRVQQGLGGTEASVELASSLVELDHVAKELPAHLPEYESVLKLAMDQLGERDPATVKLRLNLAWASYLDNDWSAAAAGFRNLIPLVGVDSKVNETLLGEIETKLGWLECDLSNFAEADRLLKASLDHLHAAVAADHIDIVRARTALGRLYLEQGRYTDAEQELSWAFEHARRWGTDNSWDVVRPEYLLMRLSAERDNIVRIDPEIENMVRIGDDANPDLDIGDEVREMLANLYGRQGRRSDAEKMLRYAIDVSARNHGADNVMARKLRIDLAQLLISSGRIDDAQATLGPSGSIKFDDLPQGHPYTAELLYVEAQIAAANHDTAHARALLTEALAGFNRTYGAAHWRSHRVSDLLAQLSR